MHRIIKRAGSVPWPRTFQNLRATRETELAESWPLHVVTKWIGNSQPVAAKHYLQLTDEHFERAVEGDGALQNPVQHSAAGLRIVPHDENGENDNSCNRGNLRRDAASCETCATAGMGLAGFEPATNRL